MIFAAHQPNYLPWLGFFYKLWASDLFFLLDDVQFERGRGYQNRVQIKTPQGAQWLTQPVRRKGQGLQPTNEVAFSEPDWAAKHLRTLRANYAKAPHFDAYFPEIETILTEAPDNLAETNARLIEALARHFGARARLLRSSGFGLDLSGGERIAELGRREGGTVYLSGRGGEKYQAAESFAARGIALSYTRFRPEPYRQLWGEFLPGLSALDALFNIGGDGVAEIFAATPPAEPAE